MRVKLTPWFPADVLPVREGVYEMAPIGKQTLYRYFNGRNWVEGGASVATAIWCADHAIRAHILYPWRGLTAEVKS